MAIVNGKYVPDPINYNFDFASGNNTQPGAGTGIFPDGAVPNNFSTGGGVSPFISGGVNPPTEGNGPGGFNPYIQGINAASGVANAYLGFQNLKLGKKQFGFAKDSFNKNLANQASLTNTALEDRKNSELITSGIYDRNTEAGRTSLAADLEAYTAPRRISGAPV